MKIPVVIESMPGNGYRASGPSPWSLSAEGPTPGDALQRLRELIRTRVTAGELVALEVPSTCLPFERFAGTLDAGDPIVQKWETAMEDHRRKLDENPDLP